MGADKRSEAESEAEAEAASAPAPDDESVPLSYGQLRLWFLYLLEGPDGSYNVPLVIRIRGPVDSGALRTAFDDVVERHEALRTVVADGPDGPDGADGADEPVQRVLPADGLRGLLEVHEGDEAEAERMVRRQTAAPFDLAREAPVRAELVRTGPERYVLVLVAHHIAVDGWSLGRLLADLGRAYAARRRGRAPGWAPPAVSYRDYAVWQRELLGEPGDPGGLAERQLAYWRRALAGAPQEITLPADRPRPALPGRRGGTVRVPVAAGTAEGVLRLARQAGTTVFMVGHAALAAALTALGAGEDLPIGTPVAGRAEPALDEVVGFFVNTLVLRTDTSGDPPFTELLERVRVTDLGAFEHQDVPFERVVAALAPGRSPARNPLFQVMYDVHGPEEPFLLEGTTTETELGEEVPKFDLFVVYRNRGADSDVAVTYSADRFDEATAIGVAACVARVLDRAAREPGTRIGGLGVRPGDAVRAAAWASAEVPEAP